MYTSKSLTPQAFCARKTSRFWYLVISTIILPSIHNTSRKLSREIHVQWNFSLQIKKIYTCIVKRKHSQEMYMYCKIFVTVTFTETLVWYSVMKTWSECMLKWQNTSLLITPTITIIVFMCMQQLCLFQYAEHNTINALFLHFAKNDTDVTSSVSWKWRSKQHSKNYSDEISKELPFYRNLA